MLFFKGGQMMNLAPLNDFRKKMNDDWLDKSNDLPETIYFRGLNDWVVQKTSAFPTDKRENLSKRETEFDHFSIVRPNNAEHLVIKFIKQALLKNLKNDELQTENTIRKVQPISKVNS